MGLYVMNKRLQPVVQGLREAARTWRDSKRASVGSFEATGAGHGGSGVPPGSSAQQHPQQPQAEKPPFPEAQQAQPPPQQQQQKQQQQWQQEQEQPTAPQPNAHDWQQQQHQHQQYQQQQAQGAQGQQRAQPAPGAPKPFRPGQQQQPPHQETSAGVDDEGSCVVAEEGEGWGPCSDPCGPGVQRRVMNECGDIEERPCVGREPIGCDGVCASGECFVMNFLAPCL